MDQPYPGQPDWNEDALSLGRPKAMDTPTLIEWIQRQLETPEETQARRDEMRRVHEEWHGTVAGIYGCCIRTVPLLFTSTGMLNRNEMRQIQEDFKDAAASGRTMVLDSSVTVTPIER